MSKRKILVEPSILCSDLGKISDEAKRCEVAGADALHLDIMDGHFVPNISFGPGIVAAVNRATNLFLDVHLMIYNPFEYIEKFVASGADRITFHFEATEEIEEMIEYIRKCNVQVGLAINPETTPTLVLKYLPHVDLLHVMTVHPGFGGQAFLMESLDKIRFFREHYEGHILVDGGLNDKTTPQCIDAGADVIVSGAYLFGQKDMEAAIKGLRG